MWRARGTCVGCDRDAAAQPVDDPLAVGGDELALARRYWLSGGDLVGRER